MNKNSNGFADFLIYTFERLSSAVFYNKLKCLMNGVFSEWMEVSDHGEERLTKRR